MVRFAYQLIHITVVLIAIVLVENSCQIRPVPCATSESRLLNVLSSTGFPFAFTSLVTIAIASSRLPLLSNHLGDSGTMLSILREKKNDNEFRNLLMK